MGVTMKKLTAVAAAFSLAFATSLVMPTVAGADTTGTGNSGPAAYCQAGIAALAGISQGDCIQLVTGNDNANAFCNLWQGPYGVYFFGVPYPFSSLGECVSYMNEYFFHS